jgi:hypothetical protein
VPRIEVGEGVVQFMFFDVSRPIWVLESAPKDYLKSKAPGFIQPVAERMGGEVMRLREVRQKCLLVMTHLSPPPIWRVWPIHGA